MAKKTDRIITSVYLTKEMCNEIDKLATRENVSRNEQIRRFIEKGLDIEGYTQNVDFISSIIRQEFTAVYHIEDIKAVAEQQTNRLAKMLMKSGKIDAAGFFLLIKVLMNLAHEGTEDQFDQDLKDSATLASSKQDKLVSGSNIKTINGETILGSGDILITGSNTITKYTKTADYTVQPIVSPSTLDPGSIWTLAVPSYVPGSEFIWSIGARLNSDGSLYSN